MNDRRPPTGCARRPNSSQCALRFARHAERALELAGRTAEEILFGEASRGDGGKRCSELHEATALAAAMVASLGISGPKRLLFLAPNEETDEVLSYADVRGAAHTKLMRAAEACHSILLAHRAALGVSTLLRAGRLDGTSPAAIIRAHRDDKDGRD